MKFTQKETMLLKDLKDQEQTCVEKYTKYASDANDSQLKNLFSQLSQHEQQHLSTITQIMSGTVPSMQSGGGQQQMQLTFTPSYDTASSTPQKQKDSFLCSDLLSTEKFVSAEYNTCIFEFKDTNIRSALNHIQKEEQQHGEQIYKYMEANGMYN
jgi:spore coat protein CotF